jgi:hypothetical protein
MYLIISKKPLAYQWPPTVFLTFFILLVTGQPLSGMTCNRDAKAVRAAEVGVGVWGKAPTSINPDPIGSDL